MRYDPYPIVGSHAPESLEFGRILDEDGTRTNRLRYGGGVHSMIFGPNGSGKDTRLIMPNLLRMSGARSCVAVDPKGELAFVTSPYRKSIGNRVGIFNPTRVLTGYRGHDYMNGCGFNPLCAINPYSPTFNKDAGQIGEALIPMSSTERNPFFPLTARALIGGLSMYEICKAVEQRRVPSLVNVRRMICEVAQEAQPEVTYQGKVIRAATLATGIPRYALEMTTSIIEGMKNKGGMFTDWTKSIKDVAATARSETEFLDDPLIADSITRNDFDLRDLKRFPTTIYPILQSGDMQRYGKWLRLLLTVALQVCSRPREGNEPSVLFIISEFSSLGHMSLIEDNFTVVRGSGIQMMPVLQDINQLRQLYKDRWQTFMGNSDATMTFAPNDTETADWFSKRCGETQGEKVAISEAWNKSGGNNTGTGNSTNGVSFNNGNNYGWSYNVTANTTTEQVPVFPTSHLYSMGPGEMCMVVAGMAGGTHAHALPYWEQASLAGRYQPNPYHDRMLRMPQPDYRGSGGFFPQLG